MDRNETPTFGDLLRVFRERAGLTQEELAERSGLSRDAISALERGRRRRPYMPTIYALADALSLSDSDRDAFRQATRLRGSTPDAPMPRPVPTRIPESLTSLIGRSRELAEITDLVSRDGVRLITITGPGGVGKTRLAIELARSLEARFSSRVVFVPLGTIWDNTFVLPTIAEALGVRNPGGEALIEQIAIVLGDQPLLLILDNFEHLADATTAIGRLVRSNPELTLVVTSRVPLRLSGEVNFPLQPLATGRNDSSNEAVRLFVERARQTLPGFELSTRNETAVAAICRRLDGLPLAIELAAARIKVLPPDALLARLEEGIDLLTGGPRDQEPRLQSVRSAIAWSYELLDPREQSAFRALSVFVGEFSLEAAESVLRALNLGSIEVVETVASLIDKSLVRGSTEEGTNPQYAMLFTIRSFALAELEASPDSIAVHRAHAEFILSLTEEAAEAFRHLAGPDQWPWFAVLEQERGNWRAALAWLHEHGDSSSMLRLTTSLAWFWYVEGPIREGLFWLERAIAMSSQGVAPELRPRALVAKGLLDLHSGRLPDARATLIESLQSASTPGEPWWIASAELFLGMVATADGEYEIAEVHLQRSIDVYRSFPHEINARIALGHMSAAALGRGQAERAFAICNETIDRQRSFKDLWGLGRSLGYLSLIAGELGDLDSAARALRENLEIRLQSVSANQDDARHEAGAARWQAGVWDDAATSLSMLAVLQTRNGMFEEAAHWLGAASAIRHLLGGLDASLPERDAFLEAEARVRHSLGSSEFEKHFQSGSELTGDQALHVAIEAINRIVSETTSA